MERKNGNLHWQTKLITRFHSRLRFLVSILTMIVASIGFSGCDDVDIKDGRIPAEYLEQARALEGVYPGQMDRKPVDLSIQMAGDKVILTSSADILGEGCQSFIGNLRKVSVDKTNQGYRVKGAKFDFNPGRCSINVSGKSLNFTLKQRGEKTELVASLMQSTEWRRECHVECSHGGPHGGTICKNVCESVPYSVYLNGKFVKAN